MKNTIVFFLTTYCLSISLKGMITQFTLDEAPVQTAMDKLREEKREAEKNILYQDQQQRAAEGERWKRDLNTLYAKAAGSVGAKGFDGMMDQAGLSNVGMKEYFQEKYFNKIEDKIKEITQFSTAHAGRKSHKLLGELETLLSDPGMTKEMRQYALYNEKIEQAIASYDKLPEWKKQSVNDPRFLNVMTNKDKDGNVGAWHLDEKYYTEGDRRNEALFNWGQLSKTESAFSIDDVDKLFKEIHPKAGTYGYSMPEAMNQTRAVLNRLSAQQREDVGLEYLYESDPLLYHRYVRGLIDPKSDEYKKVQAKMDEPLNKLAKTYAASWVHKKDPTASTIWMKPFLEQGSKRPVRRKRTD